MRQLVIFAITAVLCVVANIALLRREARRNQEQAVKTCLDEIEGVILSRLFDAAVGMGVPIEIVDELDCVGHYRSRARQPVGIKLHRAYVSWFLLAHELGHHVAIARRGDRSEAAADREGHRLVLSLLSDDEAKKMRSIVDIMVKT